MLARIAACVLLLVLLVPARAAASPDAETVAGDLGASLDRYLAALVPYGFTGAALVEQGGEMALHKGYGFAHDATQRPVTTETVYSLGSITKHFTAVAVMLLKERGLLALDAPISAYLADLPADKAAITIRQLLSHTSGLGGFGNVIARGGQRPALYAQILASPLTAAPGERYEYSNAGYALLRHIIETASGQSYREFVHDNLFAPAGMLHSGFIDDGYAEEELAFSYIGYIEDGSPLTWPNDDDGFLGAGGILSTTGDLYRWSNALRKNEILSQESLDELMAPFQQLGPDAGEVFGGALRTMPSGARRFSSFGGSVPGHNAGLAIGFEEGLTIAVASGRVLDGADLSGVLLPLRDIVDGRTPPAARPVTTLETLAPYEGVYVLDSGGAFRVAASDGRLLVTAEGQDALSTLLGHDAEQTAALSDLNGRVLPLVKAALAGDASGLAALTSGELTTDEMNAFWTDRLAFWQGTFGAFESVETIGSLPELMETASLVRLNFADESIIFRFTFGEDGRLLGFGRADEAPNVRTYLPVSETEFSAFDFRSRTPSSVAFTTDTAALTLPNGVVARRN